MYMGISRYLPKKKKKIEKPVTNNKNIQPGYTNRIPQRKVKNADYEAWV